MLCPKRWKCVALFLRPPLTFLFYTVMSFVITSQISSSPLSLSPLSAGVRLQLEKIEHAYKETQYIEYMHLTFPYGTFPMITHTFCRNFHFSSLRLSLLFTSMYAILQSHGAKTRQTAFGFLPVAFFSARRFLVLTGEGGCAEQDEDKKNAIHSERRANGQKITPRLRANSNDLNHSIFVAVRYERKSPRF